MEINEKLSKIINKNIHANIGGTFSVNIDDIVKELTSQYHLLKKSETRVVDGIDVAEYSEHCKIGTAYYVEDKK